MSKYLKNYANFNDAKEDDTIVSPNVSLIANSKILHLDAHVKDKELLIIGDDLEDAQIVPMLQLTGGTWDGSGSDNGTRVFISGNVTLTGKTDCYSLTFEQGGHLTINAGARLRIWEGGITNNDCSTVNYLTILNYADEESGEFLIHPEVTTNNHPLASITIPLKAYKDEEWHSQRLSIPVSNISVSWPSGNTYFYKLVNNRWVNITSLSQVVPFVGFQVNNTNTTPSGNFVFSGQLVGNSDTVIQLESSIYNFVGVSYTGRIKSSTLLNFINRYGSDLNYWIDYENIEINNQTVSSYPYLFVGMPFMFLNGSYSSITLSYKDLVWDPSFEEEVTPTRSLMKGALSSPKPAEIDTTLEGSAIFDNPVPIFPPENDER